MARATDLVATLGAALTVALALLAPGTALGAELRGFVVNAWDETPLAGVVVVADGLGLQATTGPDGSYALELPEGLDSADLWILDGSESPLRYVHQTPDRIATLRALPPGGEPSRSMWWGLPTPNRPTSPDAGPVFLDDAVVSDPLRYTVGATLPTHIRVGRRFASTCSGNPVQRVDTVPLEEYVEGVLVPEIGVFRSIAGGPESSRAVFEAFAVAARSYAVWFYLRDPDAEYHIDDTACNQRYEEVRNDFVRTTVAATAGQIMVARSDASLLDKLEYAASCGRNGTRPEYQDPLVPDVTGTVACVGSWCGHNNCAGHEVNPALPDSGRCLVRGICQWGAAERSMRGDSYLDIIAHYQPNLQLRTVGAEPAAASLVGFVREGDVFSGPGVSGVRVALDTGGVGLTNETGYFEIADVPPGERTVEYSGSEIVTVTRVKLVEPGIVNWASQAVERVVVEPEPLPDAGPSDADLPDAGDVVDEPPVAEDTSVTDAPGPDGGADAPDLEDVQSGDADPTDDVVAIGDASGRDPDPPQVVDAGSLRAISIVGPDGIGQSGCAAAGGASAFALLWLPLLGLTRRRRCR